MSNAMFLLEPELSDQIEKLIPLRVWWLAEHMTRQQEDHRAELETQRQALLALIGKPR